MRFDPCPGCQEQGVERARGQRAKQRRKNYDPVGQILSVEFWGLWRLYPVCPCCAQTWGTKEYISLDHIVPLSRGGPNVIDNVQPLCQRCNLWKSDHIIYFDRAFWGKSGALPVALWSFLPPTLPELGQLTLLEPPLDLAARYPQVTPDHLEQITLTLTRQELHAASLV